MARCPFRRRVTCKKEEIESIISACQNVFFSRHTFGKADTMGVEEPPTGHRGMVWRVSKKKFTVDKAETT